MRDGWMVDGIQLYQHKTQREECPWLGVTRGVLNDSWPSEERLEAGNDELH